MESNNYELELSVLGSIFLNPKCALPKVMELLKPDDFSFIPLQTIYKAILRLEKKKSAIDTLLVIEELGPDLDGVGGMSFVSALPDGVPTSKNVGDYVLKVKEFSEKRKVMESLDTLKLKIMETEDLNAELDGFIRLISEIRKRELKQIKKVGELVEEAFKELNTGITDGILTGYNAIDSALKGLHKTDLIVIASDSSFGKTTFGLNVCVNAARFNKTCLIFSTEMSDKQLVKKMITAESGVDMNYTEDELKSWESGGDMISRRVAGASLVSEMPIWINDDNQTIDKLYAQSRAFKNEMESQNGKLDIIFVDYLQLIGFTSNKRDETREREVAKIAAGLKGIAKELDVPVVVMSQVNHEKATDGKRKHYKQTDLRESKAIGHACDVIIFLNPMDENDDTVYEITAGKHKNYRYFNMKASFNKNISLFTEVQ
jgi:replicative DNA helicase